MDASRIQVVKDLADHVIGQIQPAVFRGIDLLDDEREKFAFALIVSTTVTAWASGVLLATPAGQMLAYEDDRVLAAASVLSGLMLDSLKGVPKGQRFEGDPG